MNLKGFTLTELMVVLLITSIIMSLLLVGFLQFQTYNRLLKERITSSQHQIELEFLLKKDLFTHDYLRVSDSSLYVYSSTPVIYNFTEDSVFRIQNEQILSFPIGLSLELSEDRIFVGMSNNGRIIPVQLPIETSYYRQQSTDENK